MEYLDLKTIIANVIGFAIGSTITIIVAYIKVRIDVSYIKGQLSQLIKLVNDMETIREVNSKHNNMIEKNMYDINHAHKKIRDISDKVDKCIQPSNNGGQL